MFMSFFFKKCKPSKKIKAGDDGAEELVDAGVGEYDDVEDDEVTCEEVKVDDAELVDDDRSVAYNKAVVYTMRDEAIQMMEKEGTVISPNEMNEALAIMPKVRLISEPWSLLTSLNPHRFPALQDVSTIQPSSRSGLMTWL